MTYNNYGCISFTVIKCEKRYLSRKKTLYERQVMKKQKLFIRWIELRYSYNKWYGNHYLKAALSSSAVIISDLHL
jgi:hypothetical protein